MIPGDPCQTDQGCATAETRSTCAEGEFCDPASLRCLPHPGDPECVFIPPQGVFDPTPLFTWGFRRERACDDFLGCQQKEMCNQATNLCEITWTHVEPAADDLPSYYQVSSIPIVADLDGDCVPEIVFNTFASSRFREDGVLRAIRGDNGQKVWTMGDPRYRTDSTSTPAVGDLNQDGTPEVVVMAEPGAQGEKQLHAFSATGTWLWTSDPFQGANDSGAPAITNLDGEGDAEVVYGAAVFDANGKLLDEGTEGIGIGGQGPISCLADLTGDGRPEIVGGKTAYRSSGTTQGGDFALSVLWDAEVPDGYCGIANLDDEPGPEIVIVARGGIYVLDGASGAAIAVGFIPGGGHGGAPNIADFDGDGRPDIGTAGGNRYVVMRFVPDQSSPLEVIWSASSEDPSSKRTGSSVFDFDGDGRAEVVYNDEAFIRIYPGIEPDCARSPPGPGCDQDMTDDEILFKDLNTSRTRTEYPVIADVNGDFKAEIVFATSNEANFLRLSGDAGIEVWRDALDNWVPTRAVWNQHTYHITNVGLRGQIPLAEEANWLTPLGAPFNNYRQNTQGASQRAFCAPDLVLKDLRQDKNACPDLLIEATVINQGCLGVGKGVDVTFFVDGEAFGFVKTTDAIAAGGAETVTLRQSSFAPSFVGQVHGIVDHQEPTGGSLNECQEDNNTATAITVRGCTSEL